MNTEEFIKVLCVRNHISVSELARKLGKSPQNFSQMLKRGSLNLEDLSEIGRVLGCEFQAVFKMPDGAAVEYR